MFILLGFEVFLDSFDYFEGATEEQGNFRVSGLFCYFEAKEGNGEDLRVFRTLSFFEGCGDVGRFLVVYNLSGDLSISFILIGIFSFGDEDSLLISLIGV